MGFTIQVLLFASAREAAGNVSSIDLELEDGSDTAVLRCEVLHMACLV